MEKKENDFVPEMLGQKLAEVHDVASKMNEQNDEVCCLAITAVGDRFSQSIVGSPTTLIPAICAAMSGSERLEALILRAVEVYITANKTVERFRKMGIINNAN